MFEIIITTSVFLVVGALIGLVVHLIQRSKNNNADAENNADITRTEKTDAENVPMQAVILCNANLDENPAVYDYRGTKDCRAAMTVGNGGRTCTDGCIGLGSCAEVCPENAITIRKGIAAVDVTACTGCGECLNVCPKHLIVLRPRNFRPGRNCIRNCPGGICGACELTESGEEN